MSKRKKSGMKRIGLLLTMVMVFSMMVGTATPAMATPAETADFQVEAHAYPETLGQDWPCALWATTNSGKLVDYTWYNKDTGNKVSSLPVKVLVPGKTTTYQVKAREWVKVGSFFGLPIYDWSDPVYDEVTVTVPGPWTVKAEAEAEEILPGQSTTLSASSNWDLNNITYTWHKGSENGTVVTGTSPNVSPVATTTYYAVAKWSYTLRIAGHDIHTWNKTVSDSVTVTVKDPTLNLALDADPDTIIRGEDTSDITATLSGAPGGGETHYQWFVNGSQDSSLPDGPVLDDVAPSSDTTYQAKAQWKWQNPDGEWYESAWIESNVVTVPVYDPIHFTVNASKNPVDPNESVTLSVEDVTGGSGGYTYSWSTGGNNSTEEVNPSVNTTYEVTVKDSTGHDKTENITVNVNLKASVSASDDSIIYGDKVTLVATAEGGDGSYSYEWSTGETTASIEVEPHSTPTQTYTVTVRDGSGAAPQVVSVTVNVTYYQVSPVLEYVTHNLDGSYTAHFGYNNRNHDSISLLIGNSNKFSPGLVNQGQPTEFTEGRAIDVFAVDFTGGNLVWSLDGKTATASANPAQAKYMLGLSAANGTIQWSYDDESGKVEDSSGSILFDKGDKPIVSLTAVPADDFVFVRWIGDVANKKSASTTVTMDSTKTVKALFEKPAPQLVITKVEVLNANAITDNVGRIYTGDRIRYKVTVKNIGNVPVEDIHLSDEKLGLDIDLGTRDPKPNTNINVNTGSKLITSGWPFTDTFTVKGTYNGEEVVATMVGPTTYRKLELEALVSDDLTNSLKWKATNMNAGLDLEAQWRIGEIGEGITQTGNVTVPASGSVEFTSVYDGDNQKCMLFVDNEKHVARAGNYTEVKAWEFYKQADVEKGLVAQEHTYTITVQNVGNIPLDDLTIMDSLTGTVVEDLDLNPLESRSFTVAFTPYADDLYEVDEVWYLDNTATLYQENPGNVVRMTIALDDDPDRLSWLAEDSVTLEVQMRYLLELSGGAHGRVEANYADAGVSQRVAGDSISVWLYPDTAVHINTSSHSGYQFGYWVGGPWNMRLRNPSVAMTSDISSRAVHVEIQEQATPSPSPSTSPAGLTGIFRAFAAPSPTPAPTPSPSPTPTPQVTPAPSESAAPPADTGGDDDTVTIDENDVPAGTASAKGTGFFSHWWSWMVLALGLLLLLLVLLLILSRRKKGQEQH